MRGMSASGLFLQCLRSELISHGDSNRGYAWAQQPGRPCPDLSSTSAEYLICQQQGLTVSPQYTSPLGISQLPGTG